MNAIRFCTRAMTVTLLAITASLSSARAAAPAPVPDGYRSAFATVDGLRLHYVIGGRGTPLLLIHGWGSTWYMWRKVMPALAQQHTTIVVDLPGFGESDVPTAGFDKATTAMRVHALMKAIGVESANVVGHDIGVMVAFAYANEFPRETRTLTLVEAPIPDTSVFQAPALTAQGPYLWNFGFFATPVMPEFLTRGREQAFLERFVRDRTVNQEAFTAADFNEYGRSYGDPARMSASFNYFRTFNQDVAQTAIYAKHKLNLPVLAIGAAGSLGEHVPEQVRQYATNVEGHVVDQSGHWVPEERPDTLLKLLEPFLKSH
ncbi:alpha/beta fold hydrolase [Deinococcus ruber]|uniref:AB hydrolase-1 domain-containing protein n=1 Tax=Deinococcus ruber TaxID=1848197 RepID=A0A918KXA0_9DEIO|nr:alpha/beta hydrolase [Deinococcus ruber]GGR38817.1 hypothetical protein GCM10008957_54800 [Deinococcus ruber]